MKTAFFSVIYAKARPYFNDFFTSLVEQTYKKFDVVIINDGVDDAQELKKAYPSLSLIILEYQDSISKVREYGINYLIQNSYDVVVFGDCDDYFSSNRVQSSLNILKSYDIIVNDVTLVQENKELIIKEYFSKEISNFSPVTLEMILEKNIFGLSNTAIKLSHLKEITFDKKLIAVDWFFFTQLLLLEKSAYFTTECITYYRQYADNIVGLNQNDKKILHRGLHVKLLHYKNLLSYHHSFQEKYLYFKQIEVNNDIKEAYLSYCQKQEQNNFWWWENIRSDFEINKK